MKFFLPRNFKLVRVIFTFFLTALLLFSAIFYPVLASTYSISPSTYSISSGGDNVFNASGYSSSSTTASSSQVALSTASDWVDTNWSYRKAIIITGSTAGIQTNYQVQVSVTYDSDMQADFDDIRFTDSNGTTLVDHWLESKTDSTSAVFWVEVPTIPASPSTTTIYMYYGNSSASSVSNGDNTFIFFDGFDGSDGDQYDSSKWTFTTTTGTCTATKSTAQTYSGNTSMKIACTSGSANLNRQFSSNQTNIAIKARMYDDTADNTTNRILRIASATGPAEVIEGVAPGTSTTYYTSARAGVWGTSSIARSTGWHLFEYRQTTTTLYLDVDGTQTRSVSSTGVLGSSNNYIGIADWASVTADIWLDNYIVRKYVSPEPSVGAAGTETGSYASSGTWTSPSLDLTAVSSWASLSDTVTLNGGTISYETQSSSDNSAWSDWEAVTGSEPWTIASSAGRYLKIRATLNAASNQTATPTLTGITIAYTSEGDNAFNASGYSSSSTTASSSQVALSTASDWMDTNWSYRKAIIITGSTAGIQTNYQVQVSVTYDSDMQADFDDIRFTDSNGTTLVDHWLESKTDSTSAVFWVEVPTIPASPSTTTIYMYYGNGSASSVSDGDSAFLFFDDDFIADVVYEEAFTSLDSDVWRMIDPEGDGTFSISGGIAEIHAGTNDGNSCNHMLGFPSGKTSRGDLTIEYRAKTNNYNVASGNDPKWGFKETRNDQYVVFAGKTDDRTHLYALTGGDFSASSTYTQLSVDYSEYHVYRIELTDTQAKFYIDDALVATHTTYLPNTNSDYNIRPYAAVGGGNTGGFEHIAYIDYVNLNMEQSLNMDKWGFGGTFLDRTLGAIDGDMHIAIPDQVGSYGGIILSTKQSFTPGFALTVKSNIIANKNVQYHLSDIKGHISSDGIRTQDYGAGSTYNHQKAVGGVWTTVDTSSITTGSHEIEYIIDASGNAKYLVDDVEEASTTGINTGIPYYFVPYTQYVSGASEQKIDQVYARKYASSEPSVGAAGAETSPLYASSGTWTSASLDLIAVSAGASLSDTVTLNGGTISYETQSSSDNSAWSDWEAVTGADPYAIQSPSGRYLKIRATLTSSGDQTATPVLTGLVVTYSQNQNPNAPSSLGSSSLVDGSWGADNTPTLTFSLSDSDGSDTVQYQIQIDDDSDFSSPVVDYTSALAAQGSAGFTVGQAAGSGSYTTGSEGQALSDGSYYWQVKEIDNSSAESSYSQANSGAIAFKVDATGSSAPGTPSTTTPTTDTTPAWSWTASVDSGSGLASVPYTLQWSQDSGFSSGVSSSTASTNSFTHSTVLSDGTWYFRVKATDAVSNASSYSSNGSVVIDTTIPTGIELSDPGDNSYTNSERPTFKWKATTDATAGMSKYRLEIDNGDSGDFAIDGIPVSRTTDYETNKYLIHYENFSDSDSTNNYISLYTKHSIDWDQTGENDGKLKEGKRTWKIIAYDNAGNTTESGRTLYADRTGPSLSSVSFASSDILGAKDGYTVVLNPKPAIKGNIFDNYSPDKIEVSFYKQSFLLGIEISRTLSIRETFYLDNSANKTSLSFSLVPSQNIDYGQYRVDVVGVDKAGNRSGETSLDLWILSSEKAEILLMQTKADKEQKNIVEKIKESSQLSLPELEKKAVLRREKEISEFKKTIQSLQDSTAYLARNFQNLASIVISSFAGMTKDITERSTILPRQLSNATTAVAKQVNSTVSSIGNAYQYTAKTTPKVIGNTMLAVASFNVSTANIINNSQENAKNKIIKTQQGMTQIFTLQFSNAQNFVGNTAPVIANSSEAVFKRFNASQDSAKKQIVETHQNTSNTISQIGIKTRDGVSVTLRSVTKPAVNSKNFAERFIKSTTIALVTFESYMFDDTPTKIDNVALEEVGRDYAVVTWKTNHYTNSNKVNYGQSLTYGQSAWGADGEKNHKVSLTGLKPGEKYYFEVMSQNKNYAYDAYYSFETEK